MKFDGSLFTRRQLWFRFFALSARLILARSTTLTVSCSSGQLRQQGRGGRFRQRQGRCRRGRGREGVRR